MAPDEPDTPDPAEDAAHVWLERTHRLADARRRRTDLQLMGAKEVAEALGVNVANLQFITDLPPEHQRLAATRIWWEDEIRAFADVYNARRRRRSAD